MSEPNEPVDEELDARLRRLMSDATDDAPVPPSPQEMMQMPRPTTTDRSRPSRRWVAVGAIGLVAAVVIALIVVPLVDDDDALTPVDTVPATTDDSTDSTVPEVARSTTVPTTSEPHASTPSSSTVAPAAAPTAVIAALDANGDAVLIDADRSGERFERILLHDGPDPDTPAPEEGPGPNGVDAIALSPDGSSAAVGFCCEPIAGSVVIGPPGVLGDEQSLFGYAPAVSPDGRLLAVGQIAGPATALYDAATLQPLDVPTLSEDVGVYSPYDTMWLDESRVVGLGILSDGGNRWVAIPMTVEGDAVTVGEAIDLSEILPTFDQADVRVGGFDDEDHFLIHVRGEPSLQAVEFRNDGVLSTRPSVSVDDKDARSIWFETAGPIVWVGADGVLHRGDQVIEGEYLWARPTDATSWSNSPESPDPVAEVRFGDDVSVLVGRRYVQGRGDVAEQIGLVNGIVRRGTWLVDDDAGAIGAVQAFAPDEDSSTRLIVFGVYEDGGSSAPQVIEITDAFIAELPEGHALSIHHSGCEDAGTFDARVVAVVDSSIVGSSSEPPVAPAVQAWRFTRDGVEEIDPSTITCELLGAPNPALVRASAIDVGARSVFGYSFGDQTGADETVAALMPWLGEPTLDSGWVAMPAEWACTMQPEVRTVWWADFRMTFERDRDDERLTGWSVGDPTTAFAPLVVQPDGPVEPPEPGVSIDLAVGIGSDRREILDALGDEPFLDELIDRIVAGGTISLIVHLDGDTVTGIGVGRNDCIDEAAGDL